MKPVRIQRKRTKGWRMPANTYYAGRPGKLGNPFIAIDKNDRSAVQKSVAYFRAWVTAHGNFSVPIGPSSGVSVSRVPHWNEPNEIRQLISQLAGKNLACFCRLDQPCHVDVILELANVTD